MVEGNSRGFVVWKGRLYSFGGVGSVTLMDGEVPLMVGERGQQLGGKELLGISATHVEAQRCLWRSDTEAS
jgi:hypothetical protein